VGIFAVLVSAANLNDIFGIFIAAWIAYQSFEAYHTARARRDGSPLPDPLGLNEIGSWLHPHQHQGSHQHTPQPGAPFAGFAPQPGAQPNPPQAEAQGGPWQAPFTPPVPPPFQQPGAPFPPVQPFPPAAPFGCRSTPVGAIVLIGLGVIFLLGQFNLFSGWIFKYSWPVVLIAMGVWMVIRRIGDHQGGQ